VNATSLEVRRLGPADEPTLVAYLERDRANNLFHLANLAQLGMDCPDLRYFGAFDGPALVGELMLMRRSAGVVWDDPDCLPALLDVARRQRAEIFTGQRRGLERLLALLPASAIRERLFTHYARITAQTLRPWRPAGERLATLDDADVLAGLYARNLLMAGGTRAEHRARIERTLTTGGMIAWIERDGVAVSAARTSAIGYGMAMIGGVVTLPEYRRQGFARACTGLLTRELLGLGVEPYLNYDPSDPAPTACYRRLGYEDFDEWLLIVLNEGW
jgi:GNAT superfamily N-acetyltransferase